MWSFAGMAQTGAMSSDPGSGIAEFRLRPARFPADLEAVAAAMTAAAPRFPMTPRLLAERNAARDPALKGAELVAEVAGAVVAVGSAEQQGSGEHADAFRLNLRVAEAWQRRGVGRALLGRLEQEALALGGRVLKGNVRQDVPGAVALAERGGYRRAWTRYESRLKVPPGHTYPEFEGLLERVQREGVVFRSLTEVADDPQRDRRLWELDWRLMNDVPLGMSLSRPPLDVWVSQTLTTLSFQPDLSFVALDPAQDDPLTGPYIGLSTLEYLPGGFYVIGMTGVLPGYRGRGVAKALKVRAMRALAARPGLPDGGSEIRTFNDPPNVVMLGMNASLGFERGPDIYRYERELREQ